MDKLIIFSPIVDKLITWKVLVVPDSNPSGKMPVLDLNVWMEGNTIQHSFYKKDISSIYTILKRSALSSSTKSQTLFMESISVGLKYAYADDQIIKMEI